MSRALTPAQAARAGLALLVANARYWSTVAPVVRTELARWQERAEAIPDPLRRGLALGKLREERFNAEAAATLATLAPRAWRRQAVEAIVALQVAYDYLDALGEQPSCDEKRLYGAFIDALSLNRRPDGEDGYARELASTVKDALARLPAAGAVAQTAHRGARRCAEAQALSHAATRAESAELERWAKAQAAGTALQWPELLAGAQASVLCLHALIAAAAGHRTTPRQAEELDGVYLSIGALTMLDSLIDREQDLARGEQGYDRYYESREQMAQRLADVARDAAGRARGLPHAGHHLMTLAGVVAYYGSAPQARGAFALPVTAHLRHELRPLIAPTLAVMRAWRLAKRVRHKLPID